MKQILCFGDSNTYGHNPLDGSRLPRDCRWTGILQLILGREYHVIEEGCNGRTTRYREPGAEWKCGLDSIDVILNTHKPIDIFITMLGTNDLKYFYNASPEDIAEGAEMIVKEVIRFTSEKQPFVPEILLIAPPVIGQDMPNSSFYDHFKEDSITRSERFGELYEEVAKRNGCKFINAADYVVSSKEDSLHLMPEQHAILAEEIAKKIRGYEIRKTELSDVDQLLNIFDHAKTYMYENGNPDQWEETYPDRKVIMDDILRGESYVYVQDGQIHGTFVLKLGEEPNYEEIQFGQWIDDEMPYGTIHRIASDGTVHGFFNRCLAFCEDVIPNIRIDTHEDNKIMLHLIEKNHFQYCGIIHVRDQSPRFAFQKLVNSTLESEDYEQLVKYLLDKKSISIQKSRSLVINRRTRITDFGYETIPDAEITFMTGDGKTLYAFAYQAQAYEEYGILDQSWLDYDYDGGETDKSEHLMESYDSVEDALDSPYIRLYLELKEMLANPELFLMEEE